MKEKKKVLFVYPDMIIGGSTTALIAFLKKIDYSTNEVDLLLLSNGSYRLDELPPEVHVLPDAFGGNLTGRGTRFRKIANYLFSGKALVALAETLKSGKRPLGIHFSRATFQMLSRIHCELSRIPDKEYNLAIAYLELWPTVFTAEKVRAKRKAAWCHVDYTSAKFNPVLDLPYYQKMDLIFCVSPECSDAFRENFPSLQERVSWTANLIDTDRILKKADSEEKTDSVFNDYKGFRMVTVARLDIFHKGLDRIAAIAEKLKKDGHEFRWYLVGSGPDEAALAQTIAERDISDRVYLLGAKDNPYPYMKQADLYVMASRYEGKPIAVTEAQILQTPVLVTRYASAGQQIEEGGGCVVENDESALYEKLKAILDGIDSISRTKYTPTVDDQIFHLLEL